MSGGIWRSVAIAVVVTAGAASAARADSFVETSFESRFQLDFHVADAALKKLLPAGWEANVAAAGPAKDANIRMIFADRVDIVGADGKPVGRGTNLQAFLAVPVKQTGTGTVGQMIVAGITEDPSDVPGPYGVYVAAKFHRMERTTKAGAAAKIQVEENWDLAAASGERLQVHVTYERGAATKLASETKFFSGANPSVYQVSKIEQGLDIMRNATVPVPNRVKSFRYKASGGKIGALFDGTERVLSFDSIPWQVRTVSAP
jgi:hypothetical protein